MAQSWSQVAQNPAYQALPPDQQEAARQQYFQQVVAPQLPDDNARTQAKAQFDKQTGPSAIRPDDIVVRPTSDQLEAPSVLDQLGRSAVLTGKSVAEGAVGLGDLLATPIRAGYNAVARGVGHPEAQLTTGSEAIGNIAQQAAPDFNFEPQNAGERYGNAISRGVGGALTGIGVGNILSGSAAPVAAGVGRTLAANPGTQLASATTGSLASQGAKDAGAGPIGQIAAGLVGGLLPVAPSALGAGAKAILGGGGTDANIQQIKNNISDFANAGATPTVGQATQSPIARGAESLLSKTPGAVNVMKGAAKEQADQVSGGLSELANKLAPNADTGDAGRAITRGVTGPGGFVDRFKDQSNQLYNKLDDYLPQDTRVSISNTQKVLPELNALIQGAPNTSKLFQNAKIMGIENGLKADALSPEAAMSRPEVQQAVAKAKAQIDATNQNIQAQNAAGQAQVDQANAMRAGQAPQTFTPKPLISDADANEQLKNVAASFVDNKLPYQAVKQLRTLVGDQLNDFSLTSDVPRSKWKAVYAALSNDLKGAADAQGPDATQAWNRANNYYSAGQNRLDAISGVLDKSGGPEAVFNAAMSGTKDGASTLKSVMQSLQPDQQKVLSAAVINRLGKATAGQQNAAGDEFSMGSFLTNWNKLSPQAKSTLFDRYGPTFSKDMDSVANVASNVREGSKYLANPSGTGPSLAALSTVGGFIQSVFTGHPGIAAGIAAGAGTANLGARLMTNPTFVKFLATKSNVPLQGLAPTISALRVTANEKKDPDLKAAADIIQQQANQQNQGN